MDITGNMRLNARRAECVNDELSLMDILGVTLLQARDTSNCVSGSHSAMYSLFHNEQANPDSIPFRPLEKISRLEFYDPDMNEATGSVEFAIWGLRFCRAISGNIILGNRQVCFVDVLQLALWASAMMPEELEYTKVLAKRYRALTTF